jgi:hypothetical protein
LRQNNALFAAVYAFSLPDNPNPIKSREVQRRLSGSPNSDARKKSAFLDQIPNPGKTDTAVLLKAF